MAHDQGIYVGYDIELRMLMYLSDKAADRQEKRKKAEERAAQLAAQRGQKRVRHV